MGDFACGALAGALADTCLFPLDTVRARLMVMASKPAHGLVKEAAGLIRVEGFSALYKGIGVHFLASVPANGIFYTTYEAVRAALGAHFANAAVCSALGGAAGCLASLAIYSPMEVVKQRAMVTKGSDSLGALRTLLRSDGPLGLYRGVTASAATWAPYFGIYFFVYESLVSNLAHVPHGEQPNFLVALLCGLAAGVSASALTNPFDVIKTRLMIGDNYTDVVHSFIIRHPAKAIASLYSKSCVDNEKTGYSFFDPREAGFTAMGQILEHVEQLARGVEGAPPIVIIDADDLLEDPEGIMAAYCAAVGLPFEPSMLSWMPGPVKELESPWSGWTDDVINSSGITRRAKSSTLPPVDTLPREVQATVAEAMPVYEAMHARRLRAAPKKRKAIGTSFSVDDALFPKFKAAVHSAVARSASDATDFGKERRHIISLSKPIRAVLSADVLLSGPPTVVAA